MVRLIADRFLMLGLQCCFSFHPMLRDWRKKYHVSHVVTAAGFIYIYISEWFFTTFPTSFNRKLNESSVSLNHYLKKNVFLPHADETKTRL